MALGAQVADHRRKNKMLVLCAMRPVAGKARQSKVLVPRVNKLLADRVR